MRGWNYVKKNVQYLGINASHNVGLSAKSKSTHTSVESCGIKCFYRGMTWAHHRPLRQALLLYPPARRPPPAQGPPPPPARPPPLSAAVPPPPPARPPPPPAAGPLPPAARPLSFGRLVATADRQVTTALATHLPRVPPQGAPERR